VQNRFVSAVGAAVLIVGIGGCSSSGPADTPQPPGGLPPNTVHVTVNGQDAGTSKHVKCGQTTQLYTIESGDQNAGVTAMLRFGDKVTAQSVEIRNLAGFTGSFWEGTVGKGEASILGSTYKISGTAVGANNDKPNAQINAPFEIRANC
jgi:lipoprotein LpqH